jgi:hypothetical protein
MLFLWMIILDNDIFFLKYKSEVFDCFQKNYCYTKTQFKTNIKIFRTDSEGEFVSKDFKNYLDLHVIIHQKSCPSQQN